MYRFFFSLILLFLYSANFAQLPYQNSQLPIEARVKDLLSRMTDEEKFRQLFMIPGDMEIGKEKLSEGIFGLQTRAKGKSAAAAEQLLEYSERGDAASMARANNEIQRFFREETRLGIPALAFEEALHGLVQEGATAFPVPIGLAASWDTSLMHQVSRAIAKETRSRGIRQILSPVVNIARDPRWGRVEETYGEDPYLTTQMALAFVSEFEQQGVVTTPKHFVANVGDGGRDSYPIHFNERLLEEIYFPAFKACFQQGGSRSVMTSYNSLDGTACTSNPWLLTEKLKKEWGFRGFVISDAGATGGANVLHFTSESYPESGKQSVEAGLDVIFQTSFDHLDLFRPPFAAGEVKGAAIDSAVARILRAKFELGLFENPYVPVEEASQWNGHEDHRELAIQAARESMVLLKNDQHILPLDKNLSRLAIIGLDAQEARLGGYSGPGNDKVSILEGVQELLGDQTVLSFVQGVGRDAESMVAVPSEYLFSPKGDKGLQGDYFANPFFEGEPSLKRLDSQVDFGWTLFSPDPSIPYDWYSVRWTGNLKAPESGTFHLGVEGNDGYRLYVNGKMLINQWDQQSFGRKQVAVDMQAGESYELKLEYHERTGNAKLKLIWDVGVQNTWQKEIAEAVAAAQEAEYALVVAGLEEGEFQDRARLGLPGHQEEMIQAVAATGTPTVVLLVGGSAITMQSWLDDVSAVLEVWYPGEAGGIAVAEVLFGDFNPAGRLPITFPMDEAQLPLYYNHKPTGRGDNYRDLTGEPLFPFGYGLSYTEFTYSDLQLVSSEITAGEKLELSFTLSNTGDRAGEEVVQLYLRDVIASVTRPVMELKGFQRVYLAAGETKNLQFVISPEMLTLLDKDLNPQIEAGEWRLMIGASSKDIRLRTHFEVKEK